MNNQNSAGAEMARLRREKKLTQTELAATLGITQRMVAACESGERRPSPGLAQRIGQELGMPWTEFYEDGGTE